MGCLQFSLNRIQKLSTMPDQTKATRNKRTPYPMPVKYCVNANTTLVMNGSVICAATCGCAATAAHACKCARQGPGACCGSCVLHVCAVPGLCCTVLRKNKGKEEKNSKWLCAHVGSLAASVMAALRCCCVGLRSQCREESRLAPLERPLGLAAALLEGAWPGIRWEGGRWR